MSCAMINPPDHNQRSQEEKEALFEKYIPLAEKIAKTWQGKNRVKFIHGFSDELIPRALEGLWKGILSLDRLEKDVDERLIRLRLRAYVLGEIKMWIREEIATRKLSTRSLSNQDLQIEG